MSSSSEKETKNGSQSAVRRLQRDLVEWRENAKHFVNIGANPLESDILNWHFNMIIADVALHGQIRFPTTYPFDPPRVSFFGDVPHRQISYNSGHGLGYLCLDMLQHKLSGYYQGWSSSYSVVSVIAQMETILHRLGKNQLPSSWRSFRCDICGHDGRHLEEFYPEATKKRPRNGMKKSKKHPRDSGCLWTRLNRDVEGVIFTFLSQSDLGHLMFVNVHLQEALLNSRVYHSRMVTCFHSHQNFGDFLDANRASRLEQLDAAFVRGHVFGIGFGMEFWSNENSKTGGVTRRLKDVNIVPDVLSFQAFCEGVRFSVWREERFDEFLPLYLNNQHGEIALDLAERVIEKAYRDEKMTPSGEVRAPSSSFEPKMALNFLSKVMNTTVVRLMLEVEESGDSSSSIPLFTSIKALQSYMYCYHLLVGFCKRYPSILEHARQKVNEFVFAPHLRDKKHFPDLGELLIYVTIVPMSWSVFGPVVIEEGLCRNAKWILEKCPWLIQTDKNIHVSCVRLRQSFDATVVSKRLFMFQFYFLEQVCGVGKLRVSFDLESKLKEMNGCLGQVRESVAVGLQRRCRRIFQVDDWMQFFELTHLPCPSARRLSHDLREAMLESERKGYQRFVETKIDGNDDMHTAHEDTDLCLCSGKILSLRSRETEGKEVEEKETEREESVRRSLDVAFCVDCTGSMSSYLSSVKVHIAKIARKLDEEENVNVQFAMVGYRDHGSEAGDWSPSVTKVAEFSKLEKFSKSLRQFDVGGGGAEEAVADGWHDILGLKWRRMSVKAVIQVADIGCHGLTKAYDVCSLGHDPVALAREMLERDITLYNVGCTMRGWDSEQFFRGTAHMTGGLYLTLKDARKLPSVIVESTKEGLSLTKIIPQVLDLMMKCRKEHPSATRDQVGYLVWRELVSRGVRSKKVSCVEVDGGKVTECVAEISEAGTLEEVRRILKNYRERGWGISSDTPSTSSAYVLCRSYDEYRRGVPAKVDQTGKMRRGEEEKLDGRLITLEQTMRCMNRATQMGDRLQWMKHGCVYRQKQYLREESEKRFVEYGVEYRGKMRRIKRHNYSVGTVVEWKDFKSKRVYVGKVIGVDESRFEIRVRVGGLRGTRTAALTSRNISKSGRLMKNRFAGDGIIDPQFREMEQQWERKCRKEKKEEGNIRREQAENEDEKENVKPVARVERVVHQPVNAWKTQKKTIAASLRRSMEEEKQHIADNATRVTEEQVSVSPSPFAACQLSRHDMVVRSMLAILPPRQFQRGMDSIRQVHDTAYCRWMAHIPLMFPFVDGSHFDSQEGNLRVVFDWCGMRQFQLEMVGFDFMDRVPTDRDGDPLVTVYLKLRVTGCDGDGQMDGWMKLCDCLGRMYPKFGFVFEKMNPHVVVARVARSRARKLVMDLDREWRERRLIPAQFDVNGVALLSRRENGLLTRFSVEKVVPFVG